MTSYSVIVSIKSCPEFGNDGYIIMCNFGVRSMSGVEIIGGGGGGGGGGRWGRPGGGEEKKKWGGGGGAFDAPSVGGSKIKAGSE